MRGQFRYGSEGRITFEGQYVNCRYSGGALRTCSEKEAGELGETGLRRGCFGERGRPDAFEHDYGRHFGV